MPNDSRADLQIRKIQQQIDDLEDHVKTLKEELQRSLEEITAREAQDRRGEFLAAYA